MLPTNGSMPVDSVGPTFWIGGTVSNPDSLDNQAFLELQFYPNSLLKGCASGGGYNVTVDPGVYTVCSPGLGGLKDRKVRVGGIRCQAHRQPQRWPP